MGELFARGDLFLPLGFPRPQAGRPLSSLPRFHDPHSRSHGHDPYHRPPKSVGIRRTSGDFRDMNAIACHAGRTARLDHAGTAPGSGSWPVLLLALLVASACGHLSQPASGSEGSVNERDGRRRAEPYAIMQPEETVNLMVL